MESFKYGAHQFLWVEHWTDKCLSILDEVKCLGLDCFEISLGDDIQFNTQSVYKKAKELELELTIGPGNVWPMECDISLESKRKQNIGIDWHRRIIDRAAEVGAVAYNGATYGHPGHILYQPRQIAELDRIAKNMGILAEYAESMDVQLVIEPMSRFRTHILHTAREAINLVNKVQHKNLFINLDTYHMITEERDYATAIKSCGNFLWGIHACESDRGVPGGGLVPWEGVFQALIDTKPNARILMETYRTGEKGFGYKRGIFHELCSEPTDFVKSGLAFLRGVSQSSKLKSSNQCI